MSNGYSTIVDNNICVYWSVNGSLGNVPGVSEKKYGEKGCQYLNKGSLQQYDIIRHGK